MADWITYIGRFHPLWVHLPIGFLVLAVLLKAYGDWRKSDSFREAVSFSLLLGTGSAAIAATFGYLLSQSGGYEGNLLDIHQIGGWATVLLAGLAWRISRANRAFSTAVQYPVYGLLLVVLSVTGHYGGSLTHGADYLTAFAPFGEKKESEARILNSLEEAILYTDVVQPILKNKCSSCHRPGKAKGELLLDSYESLTKGGENGPVILAGDAAKSELIRRVTLPESHKEFMPAEGKEPLSPEEVEWISWWIEQGNADPNLLLTQSAPELIAWAEPRLSIRQASTSTTTSIDTAQIGNLKRMGFRVRVLSQETGALDVVLPEEVAQGNASEFLKALATIKDQIHWLSLAQTGLQDADLNRVAEFANLRRLRIENNPITNQGLASISPLTKLEVLNLNGTQITAQGLSQLIPLNNLQSLYLWNTGIPSGDPSLSQWELGVVKVVGD
ncbi:c-type cytochrome domain-containing protein [Algoriphagus aquatilis]|uniref:C-type cytochrome domain-containing protein n=1 Tax=Algoriphagus aquatilis TaxID=490186 RepID=A0ABW0BX85_9BACT